MGLLGWLLLGLLVFGLGFWLTRQLQRRSVQPQPFGDFSQNATPARIAQPSAELDRQVRDLIAQRKQIEAIKLVRQQTSWDLKASRDYVQAIASNRPVHPPAAIPFTGSRADLPPEVRYEVEALLADQQLIPAIKRVREVTGWNLATAKAYVDGLRR
jgi:ribosomal protein L7/L12